MPWYWIVIIVAGAAGVLMLALWKQYKKVGPWRDYLFGEKVYMILSLVAKSALAWQVFGGILARSL